MQPVNYEAPAGRVLDIAMATHLFASDWAYCDQMATYAAALVSQRRADSLRYANLFSSVLNELLETVFRQHHPHGEIACRIFRGEPNDRIELTIPCDASTRAFYESAMVDASSPDVAEKYLSSLLDNTISDPRIGLLELAADYRAQLSLVENAGDTLTLVVDIIIDDSAI
jgi:hypothetical protein